VIILPVPGARETALPLPEGEDRSAFLFHGTVSRRGARLEAEGFDPDESAIEVPDLLRLLEIYEELQYDGELVGVTPRALLEEEAHRPGRGAPLARFTPFYFTARNRAVSAPLGEAHRALLKATEELSRLLDDPSRREAHERLLREWDDREREQLGRPLERGEQPDALVGSMRRRERALNAVHDGAYRLEALRKVRSIRERYLEELQGGFPVVYLVRVPLPERHVPRWERTPEQEYRLLQLLSPEQIAYRVDLDPLAQEVVGADPEALRTLGVGSAQG
jgi:hypothetical protein